jgi:hypothetical protein
LLRLAAAIAALGAPGSTTAALPLHSFEISHVLFGDLVRRTHNGQEWRFWGSWAEASVGTRVSP